MSAPQGGPPGDESSGYRPMAEINVTPMVDVMLVLLIIFMVTAPLMMAQLPIELPKVSNEDLGKPPEPLVVGLDAEGSFYVGSDKVSAADLPGKLQQLAQDNPDQIVYVRADKGIPYGQVMDLLGTVGKSGFYKISLMSEQPGG
ncbi:MAG TPA: biopolymer transporter ExbD [Gammaproteobacteria bacterium]|nr:biopolymer transporter ExbD [Gammaproteobacteria bacterium]